MNLDTTILSMPIAKSMKVSECRGVIIGDKLDIVNEDSKVHWCPKKAKWVTNREMLWTPINQLPAEFRKPLDFDFCIDKSIKTETNFI
jgi:hypothetical protein